MITEKAPGRINLIGEHTDTSEGYVLPLPLSLEVRIDFRDTGGDSVTLESTTEGRWEGTWAGPPRPDGWERYPLAVARALRDEGVHPPGCHASVSSDLPRGEGLASSAALEVAFCRGILQLAGEERDPVEIARIAHRAESEFVGVRCGIMDQFASSVGRIGRALFLDTRTLDHRLLGLPRQSRVAILPSGVTRSLAASPYNDRRRETERAAEILGLRVLRDGTEEDLSALPSPERERARHVVTENKRVLDAVDALESGDAAHLGELMNLSHASLRDDYEVSCPELDALTEIARSHPGCLGARLSGAGFGGAAVALLRASGAERTLWDIARSYRDETGFSMQPLLADS